MFSFAMRVKIISLYGMVRYGMVWYGMVWYGMVWYGVREQSCSNEAKFKIKQLSRISIFLLGM